MNKKKKQACSGLGGLETREIREESRGGCVAPQCRMPVGRGLLPH